MMSEEAVSVIPSNLIGSLVQLHDPNSNSNPNPNPNSNSVKRKRSLPGTPDPDAEVIALSPKSLMATNRFICEVCKKGFQRDQNLQLHRRGHNLPWKLRQRKKEEVKKKVYVCPEKSCVHHDPCRALGDLTGIKKHFSRKHGEKKWKCDKCDKKYAVQSDWKAHSKICGTREYRCDCGTLFSRKDSFLTHRAFCDALVERSGRITSVPSVLSNFGNDHLINAQAPRIPQSLLGGSDPEGPLWLDQVDNPQLHVPNNLSVFSSRANSSCTLPDLLGQTTNMFGSLTQAQWVSCPYPAASFSNGVKLEQEENKGALSVPVMPQGDTTHMSANALLQKAFQMESTSINNNNGVFGFIGSNLSSTSRSNNNNRNNVVEIQKFLKQANQAESFNNIVNMDHMVTPRDEEWPSGQPPIMNKPLYTSSNNNEDLTRDFLGVGDDSLNRPFLQQEFNPIGSVMNLHSQFDGHY